MIHSFFPHFSNCDRNADKKKRLLIKWTMNIFLNKNYIIAQTHKNIANAISKTKDKQK